MKAISCFLLTSPLPILQTQHGAPCRAHLLKRAGDYRSFELMVLFNYLVTEGIGLNAVEFSGTRAERYYPDRNCPVAEAVSRSPPLLFQHGGQHSNAGRGNRVRKTTNLLGFESRLVADQDLVRNPPSRKPEKELMAPELGLKEFSFLREQKRNLLKRTLGHLWIQS